MSIAQPLGSSGQKRIKADKEVAKGTEPRVMPNPDAHANKTYFGRSGALKSGAAQNHGRGGDQVPGQSMVQKARRKRLK